MATAKSGNLIFLWLKSASSDNYKRLVCNQELSIEASAEEISTNTKCGRFAESGTKTYTINTTGVLDTAADGTTNVSAMELKAWFDAGTTLYFIKGDNGSSSAIIELEGTAVVTAWSLTSNVDEFVTFSATFQVSGTPTDNL